MATATISPEREQEVILMASKLNTINIVARAISDMCIAFNVQSEEELANLLELVKMVLAKNHGITID